MPSNSIFLFSCISLNISLEEMKKVIDECYERCEKILSDETEYILEGVADNIQVRLEKEGDMNEAFEKLNEEEKLAYSLHYFIEESENAPSEFFRNI